MDTGTTKEILWDWQNTIVRCERTMKDSPLESRSAQKKRSGHAQPSQAQGMRVQGTGGSKSTAGKQGKSRKGTKKQKSCGPRNLENGENSYK
jgi:hypothetical protein